MNDTQKIAEFAHDLERNLAAMREDNAMLRYSMTDWRYSHEEIESSCGEEVARWVREQVMLHRTASSL